MRLKTAVLSMAAAIAASASAAHAQPASLRDVLELQDDRRAPLPPVARYVSGDGAQFTFDRSRSTPLMKFEQSDELWILYPSPAPRGDVIYRNDVGDPVLRATKLGGLTLFTSRRPGGAPAAMVGETEVLRPPVAATQPALLQRMLQATAKASRAAQRSIPFEAEGEGPGSYPIFADAAQVTAEAITRLARDLSGRALLSRVKKVRLGAGPKPAALVRKGTLEITVTPSMGVAGRPSSAKIIVAASAAR